MFGYASLYAGLDVLLLRGDMAFLTHTPTDEALNLKGDLKRKFSLIQINGSVE